ncbi:MAG: preprotein translocase subunit SecY [Chloroflexi bacterium]|nr:preprotein translocase subunit SecY [Chloroflexota bacterium]
MRQTQTVSSRPKLIQAMIDVAGQPDLRGKVLFTLGILVIYRFVAHVPVPGVDVAGLSRFFQDNALAGMLDLFSGGALRNLSIAAMGVYPYITASIIMQLLIPVIPRLQALSREGGEAGRQKLNQITHWLTVPMAFAQSYGQLVLLDRGGVLEGAVGLGSGELGGTLAMMFSMCAGTMFLVWLGELITERGIGNGISLIIFSGIASGLPSLLGQSFLQRGNMGGLVVFFGIAIVTVFVIVLFTEAQRRIPVQYGRSVFRSGLMYRQTGSTHIPLRVNSAGMIPIIFAFSIMIFPGLVASYFVSSNTEWLAVGAGFVRDMFDTNGAFYWGATFLLVVAFAFFYALITFQQQNIAESLQRNGGFIPGIRPGKPTNDYITKVMLRITLGGALFLGIVAVIPFFSSSFTGVRGLQLTGVAMLIAVGVVLDTMRQLEAQLLMRRYEGFIR